MQSIASDYQFLFFFLFQDPVVNVRLKFCSVLPSLKSVLKLPSNRQLLQQLEQCVRRLVSSEQEPDVSAAIREVRVLVIGRVLGKCKG